MELVYLYGVDLTYWTNARYGGKWTYKTKGEQNVLKVATCDAILFSPWRPHKSSKGQRVLLLQKNGMALFTTLGPYIETYAGL
jgi:hypothetical protein